MNREIFFDTLLLTDNDIDNLEYHIERFLRTNQFFNETGVIDEMPPEKWYREKLLTLLDHHLKRIRIGFSRSKKGGWLSSIKQAELASCHSSISLCFHPMANVNSSENSLEYKLSSHGYRELLKSYEVKSDDVIFVNEKGLICETSRANIYIQKNNILYTPPCSDGVLFGTVRAKLIADDKVVVKSITRDELLNCDKVFVSNSLIGILPAQLSEHVIE